MSFDPLTNFYCSQKFTWLSLDLEKRLSYSCCSATPEQIKIDWLKHNPGKLFNTPGLHQDRIDMLANRPVSSCAEACWRPESRGLNSRRTMMQSYIPIDSDVNESMPRHLNITLGSTCNLTCSYCCKQYSSAWLRDLDSNGAYLDYQDRYQVNDRDRLFIKLGHKDLEESPGMQTLIEEISRLDRVKEIRLTGGEPFLYNKFPDLLNSLTGASQISFYTGLGVDTKRLQRQLQRIQRRDHVQVYVSAENCASMYEFNRYGNSYQTFLDNFELLVQAGFKIGFNSVISNLTVLGLADFVETFGEYPINFQFCNSPDFQAVNVLDDKTKALVIDSLARNDKIPRDSIVSNLQQNCTTEQRQQCARFLQEFARRRNLSLDIFPQSMLQWLEI